MPFLILLVALFIFTLVRGEHNVAIGICMLIVVALLATYNKTFKESLREFFRELNMILETIAITLVIVGGLLSLAKYRYENGSSQYSPFYKERK